MKKLTVLVLSLLLSASLITGCSTAPSTGDATPTAAASQKTQSTASAQPTEDPLAYLNLDGYRPVVKEGKISLTAISAQDDTLREDPNSTWWVAYIDQVMNIEIQIESVLNSAKVEKKNLLFAANELPDLILAMDLTPSELVRYGQQEGQLLALNEYIEAYMPAMLALQTDFPTMLANCTCPDGNIYTFPRLLSYKDPGFVLHLFVNTAWLQTLGMDEPATLDEFYDMLSAFKTQDPGGVGADSVVPLGGSYASNNPANFIYSALGFVSGGTDPLAPMTRNGEVEIIAGSPLYREYLTFMNKLYAEGLIDKDFYTMDGTQTDALVAAGLTGATMGFPYYQLPDYEDFSQFSALTPLTSEYNDAPVAASGNPVSIGNFVVSAKCAYPEAVARMVDFFYTEQGTCYAFDGPVVDSPDLLDIIPGWTMDPETGVRIFPAVEDGTCASEAEYTRRFVIPFYTSIIGNRSDVANARRVAAGLEAVQQIVYDPQEGEGNARQSITDNVLPFLTDRYPANVYFTDEESQRINELVTVLTSYIETETAKYITGVTSIDNIDQYYADLERLGFAEYQQFYIDAYANYLNALGN